MFDTGSNFNQFSLIQYVLLHFYGSRSMPINRKYEAERKIQPGSKKNVEWKSLLRKRSGCKRISGFDRIRGLTDLLGHLLGFGLLQLGDLGQRLAAIDATSPMTTDLLEAIVEVVFGSLDDFVKSTLVLGVDVGECGAAQVFILTTRPIL